MKLTNRGWWVVFLTGVTVALLIGSVLPARGFG